MSTSTTAQQKILSRNPDCVEANTRGDRRCLQIVIAWTEQSAEFVEQVYVGGGEHKNVFRDVTLPKACMWLNSGAQSDVAKARQYADGEIPGAKVFSYQGEADPLGKAKHDILKQ